MLNYFLEYKTNWNLVNDVSQHSELIQIWLSNAEYILLNNESDYIYHGLYIAILNNSDQKRFSTASTALQSIR